MLLAVAGCGGAAAGADGDGYTVMTWSPSGTGGTDRPGVTALAAAIARETNAKDTLAGHKLKVLTCNDHNSADGATACARQAVDAHVVAVIGSYSQHADAFMPVLESAGIPYLGGYGLSGPEFSSPLSYPVAGGTPALVAGSGRQLVEAGCKSVALIRPDTPAGDTMARYLSAALKPAGITAVDVKAPENKADFAALSKRALGDDATGNCVIAALGPDQTKPLLTAYRALNPKRTRLASIAGSVEQSVVDATGGASGPLADAYVTGWYPPESAAAWDDLRTTVKDQAASDAGIQPSDLAVQTTWVAYQVFFQAELRLRSAGKPVTAKTLRDQLDGEDTMDVGGVTPPLTWGLTDMLPSAESPRLVNTWVTFQQVKGGRLAEQQRGFVDVRWALTGRKPPQ
ncbi:ABC transporter substrate-binding protein [Kitasatospora sp. NPDC049285]|uniref:ABC transporter substrate-binding protein n=1 Tax=Kitasatospora sp. NPDC049285 TaxID=3157096 RepID=UPI00341FAD5A